MKYEQCEETKNKKNIRENDGLNDSLTWSYDKKVHHLFSLQWLITPYIVKELLKGKYIKGAYALIEDWRSTV